MILPESINTMCTALSSSAHFSKLPTVICCLGLEGKFVKTITKLPVLYNVKDKDSPNISSQFFSTNQLICPAMKNRDENKLYKLFHLFL